MSSSPDTTALVLSGGGAQGAFAVGVLNVLFAGRSSATGYQPLETSIVTGTSVGAFNASLLVGFGGALAAARQLESVWTEKVPSVPGQGGNGIFRIRGDPQDYTSLDSLRSPAMAWTRLARDSLSIGQYFLGRTASFLASTVSLENRAVQFVNLDDFVDTSPLHHLLREMLDPAAVLRSRQRLRIVATNWITGVASEFSNADFIRDRGLLAIMASSAIPGVFPPVLVGGELCVDGGVVQNTPLKPAIQLGATELHVIYLNPDPRVIPLQGQPSTIDTLIRMYFVMLGARMEEDIKTAQWINDGLNVVERYTDSSRFDDSAPAKLARVASQILAKPHGTYRKLAVHRYIPHQVGGRFGILDFSRGHVLEMIRAGEYAALNHKCTESGCVLP